MQHTHTGTTCGLWTYECGLTGKSSNDVTLTVKSEDRGWLEAMASVHQVATDPGVDKTEGQHGELEELSTAVGCQEAQAARQDASCQRHRHSQAAAQSQSHPAHPAGLLREEEEDYGVGPGLREAES